MTEYDSSCSKTLRIRQEIAFNLDVDVRASRLTPNRRVTHRRRRSLKARFLQSHIIGKFGIFLRLCAADVSHNPVLREQESVCWAMCATFSREEDANDVR